MRKFKEKECLKCKKSFTPSVATQIYCGSKTKKIGCSWDMVGERDKVRAKLPHRIEATRRLQRAWVKKQIRENTDFAKRQRAKKRAYYQTEAGKKQRKESSKRNVKTKLACNRRRELRKKKVFGFHTNDQWEELKKQHNNKCYYCGVSETHLDQIWGGTNFTKLTKDHRIPISKGGTDKIDNILPACISCNAKKRDALEDIVCISGGFDIFHEGHLGLLNGASQLGKVIVILNSDDWLIRKKGYYALNWEQRAAIIYAMRGVVGVSAVDDSDGTVCEAIRRIKPKYFANGGDRGEGNTPEKELCCELGIIPVWNVGGGKINSSTDIIDHIIQSHADYKKDKVKEWW